MTRRRSAHPRSPEPARERVVRWSRWAVASTLAVVAVGTAACASAVDGAAVVDPHAVLTGMPTPGSAGSEPPSPTIGLTTSAAPMPGSSVSSAEPSTTAGPSTSSDSPTQGPTETATGAPATSSSAGSAPATTAGTSTSGGITASTVTTTLPALPDSATTFTGKSGWQMEIAASWTKFDIPGANEEGAWATGGGSDSFANNVNVLVDKPTIKVGLQQYLDLSVAQILRAYPESEVRSSAIIETDGRQVGRIRYAGLITGVDMDAVAYVAELDDGWAIATYVTPRGDLATYAPKVEPYLATLRSSS